MLTSADLDGDAEVGHQGRQLIEQIAPKGLRLRHGDLIHARQLHLGIRAHGARHFALTTIGQAQLRITKPLALAATRLTPTAQVFRQGLAQGGLRLLIQIIEPLHGFFCGGDHHHFVN